MPCLLHTFNSDYAILLYNTAIVKIVALHDWKYLPPDLVYGIFIYFIYLCNRKLKYLKIALTEVNKFSLNNNKLYKVHVMVIVIVFRTWSNSYLALDLLATEAIVALQAHSHGSAAGFCLLLIRKQCDRVCFCHSTSVTNNVIFVQLKPCNMWKVSLRAP